MIRIRNGTNVIYDPRNPALPLVSPRLVLEDNAAGSLTFRIYDANRNYGTVRKLYPLLSVERDGKTLFRGRVVSDKKEFYNGKSVEAEGKLAFLNDSYLEPFEFSGSPEELFRMVIENHNSQVAQWQQFRVGRVTVTDPNDYIVRSSEGILNSWEALKSRCFQSSLGGHVRVRYEADGDYLDWLADYDRVSGQKIAFAKNLVDLSLETDATETYTAIRPVGAEVEGRKVDISSVNGGRNYIVDEEKAAQYGILFAPESESTWEDVTLPENLLRKAREKLSGSLRAMRETYEIRAVDLSLTDAEVEALDVCEYVPVESGPHGICGNYLLYKAEIAITEPQSSVFWLGASRRVLGDRSLGGGEGAKIPRNVSSFRNDAGYISGKETEALLEGYTKTEDVETMVDEAVSGIPAGRSAYEEAVSKGFEGTEEDWLLSLKGEAGPVPEIGENGNWLVGGQDTGRPSRGLPGTAATVKVGTVTTGKPGTMAEVKNSGTETSAVLDFVIPQGQPGSGGGSSSGPQIAGFEIREDGCLWVIAEDQATADRFRINEKGELVYRIGD